MTGPTRVSHGAENKERNLIEKPRKLKCTLAKREVGGKFLAWAIALRSAPVKMPLLYVCEVGPSERHGACTAP